MLKFENTANVGDIIKAFDFKPMKGRPDMFLTGRVVAKGAMMQDLPGGNKAYIGEGYTVEVLGGDAESVEMGRKNVTMYVPFEVDFMEYEERVTLVVTAEEVEMLIAHETNVEFH